MMREAPNLTGQDVDRDDLLAIDVPRRDLAVRVCGSAVECVAVVFRRGEGPIVERPSRHGRIMAKVIPRPKGEEEFIVGELQLLSLVETVGIVPDIHSPE